MVVQERDGVTLGAVIMVEPPLSFGKLKSIPWKLPHFE